MKIHPLLLVFLLMLPAFLSAQDPDDELPEEPLTDETLHPLSDSFSPGEEVWVFGDKVNVRAAASAQAAVVSQLAIGEKVKIRDTAQLAEMNHVLQRWCQVEFVKNGVRQTGYIWGGVLALSRVEIGATSLLFGIAGAELAQDGKKYRLEVRAGAGGRLIAAVNYHYFMDDFFQTSSWRIPNLGLNHYLGGIKINTYVSACGYESSDLYVFWDGKQLLALPRISSVADGGVFYRAEQYIFPFQQEEEIRDGKRILLKIEHGSMPESDDDSGIEYDECIKVRQMKWNGKEYIKPQVD